MTFYLKPPRGQIHLHILEECVEARLKLLSVINDIERVKKCNFQYLIDGSAYDRTGHFILRLLSTVIPNFKTFFLKTECQLFEHRLSTYGRTNIYTSLKILRRQTNEIIISEEYTKNRVYNILLCALKYLSDVLLNQAVFNHIFNSSHSQDCQCYTFKVPFSIVLDLVTERKVNLKNGTALIPCGNWKKMLTILFNVHLKLSIKNMKSSTVMDPRILTFQDIVEEILPAVPETFPKIQLSAEEVDNEVSKFPMCMQNLHYALKKHHRLPHDQRFVFSLFLKEIGLPIKEALNYWSNEYKQPSSCTSCQHNWHENKNRFVYSLRHMYGLEGKRANYRPHKCSYLQLYSNGACPFVCYTDEELKVKLPSQVTNSMEQLQAILNIRNTSPSKACCLVKTASSNDSSDQFVIRSPIDYYLYKK